MKPQANSLPHSTLIRVVVTAGVAAFEAVQLTWESTHGGVVAHHLLNMNSLPAVSNWWGLALIPALTWWLTGFLVRRADLAPRWPLVLTAFLGALVYGLTFGLSFQQDLGDVPFYFLIGIPVLGLVLRLYRPEFLVGFVLGMSWTFGAVIPAVVALVAAGWAALVHLGVYRLFRRRGE